VSIVDSCSQPERAFSSLFSVLATSPVPRFAAALVSDVRDADAVRPLLAAQRIPQAPHSDRLHDAKTGRPEPVSKTPHKTENNSRITYLCGLFYACE